MSSELDRTFEDCSSNNSRRRNRWTSGKVELDSTYSESVCVVSGPRRWRSVNRSGVQSERKHLDISETEFVDPTALRDIIIIINSSTRRRGCNAIRPNLDSLRSRSR